MSAAKLVIGDPRPTVRLERYLSDPPDVVWGALTEREQLRSWFPCDVVVTGGLWTVGASIRFPFPTEVADLTLTGEVLEVEKPRVLAFTWGEEVLRFELSPHEGGTLLVLTDELPPSAAARNAAGWDDCLDRMTGLEPAPNAWRAHFAAYAAVFEPMVGPQQGPPKEYKPDS